MYIHIHILLICTFIIKYLLLFLINKIKFNKVLITSFRTEPKKELTYIFPKTFSECRTPT